MPSADPWRGSAASAAKAQKSNNGMNRSAERMSMLVCFGGVAKKITDPTNGRTGAIPFR
ncbi:MAG TPA: hypothetical protein VJ806_15970 [Luteimonas sp.]|nr:hypothetical protein [Luteimonas sp.]